MKPATWLFLGMVVSANIFMWVDDDMEIGVAIQILIVMLGQIAYEAYLFFKD